MWPWMKRWRGWVMRNVWPLSRHHAALVELRHGYERGGLAMYDRPVPWGAEVVLVEATLRGSECIPEHDHDVGLRVAVGRLVRDHDRIVARDADLDLHVVEGRQVGPPARYLDGDAPVRDAIEMLLEARELVANASLDRLASLEAVERDLEGCQHQKPFLGKSCSLPFPNVGAAVVVVKTEQSTASSGRRP